MDNVFKLIIWNIARFNKKGIRSTATAKLHVSLAMIYDDLSELELSKQHFPNCRQELRHCTLMFDHSVESYSMIGLACIYSVKKVQQGRKTTTSSSNHQSR